MFLKYQHLPKISIYCISQWWTLHKILGGGGIFNMCAKGISVCVNCDIWYQTFIGLSKYLIIGGHGAPPPQAP
jgi:hypothetical protein